MMFAAREKNDKKRANENRRKRKGRGERKLRNKTSTTAAPQMIAANNEIKLI